MATFFLTQQIDISCMCMNVKLSVSNQPLPKYEAYEFSKPCEQPRESLFLNSLYFTGFLTESVIVPMLCETSVVDQDTTHWRIRRCMVCNREIFGTSGTKVILNATGVVIGADCIEKGKLHHWYSEVFHMIIPRSRATVPTAQHLNFNSRLKTDLQTLKEHELKLAEDRLENEIKKLRDKFDLLKGSSDEQQIALLSAVASQQLVRDRSHSIPLQDDVRARHGSHGLHDPNVAAARARISREKQRDPTVVVTKPSPQPVAVESQFDFDDMEPRPSGPASDSSESSSEEDDDDRLSSGSRDNGPQFTHGSLIGTSVPIPISMVGHRPRTRESPLAKTLDGGASIREMSLRPRVHDSDDIVCGSPD